MNWIKRLFTKLFYVKEEPKKANVILPDNQGNGMTFEQAKAKAKLGFKVRWIEWDSDHYFYWDGKYFMIHEYQIHHDFDRRLVQSNARKYIGCAWMECGKMYLTTKEE